MNSSFILSCESTVDMPFSDINGRGIEVVFYSYTIGEQTYADDMLRDPEALPHFYQLLAEGNMPTTSQVNQFEYEEHFEKLLQKGDVLHIVLGSGITKSMQNAINAAEEIRPRFPDRKLVVIDSLGASSGYGLLVDMTADLRDTGASIDEVEQAVLELRHKIYHQFFSTDLKYFRRSGRVSGPAAMLGSILNICPIMRLDPGGHMVAYDKVRGKKAAIRRTVDEMEAHAQNGTNYDGRVFICHSNCFADAEETKATIAERFPNVKDIRIFDIGTIVGSHTGPGTIAIFFVSNGRPASED